MKFVVTMTLPSGNVYCFSAYQDQFALVPMQGTTVRNALAFDTEQEARDYLDEQLAVAPGLQKPGVLFGVLKMVLAN